MGGRSLVWRRFRQRQLLAPCADHDEEGLHGGSHRALDHRVAPGLAARGQLRAAGLARAVRQQPRIPLQPHSQLHGAALPDAHLFWQPAVQGLLQPGPSPWICAQRAHRVQPERQEPRAQPPRRAAQAGHPEVVRLGPLWRPRHGGAHPRWLFPAGGTFQHVVQQHLQQPQGRHFLQVGQSVPVG